MKKDLLSTSASRFFLILLSLVQGVIIARYLFEEGKGIIGLYLATLNLTMSLGDMGGKQAYSFYMTKKGMALSDARDLIHWSLAGALFFESAFLAGVVYFQGLGDNVFILTCLFGIMALKLYNSYSISFALGLRNFNVINFSQILPAIVTLGGVILFIACLGKGVEYYFVSMFFSSLVTAAYLAWYRWGLFLEFTLPSLTKVSFGQLKEITIKGFTYAIPLFIMGLNYRLDLFILDYYKGKAEVGIYSQGVSLAQMLWFLPEIVALVIFSHSLNAKKEKKFAESLMKYVQKVMTVLGGLLVPIALISYYLIPLIYGKAFSGSSLIFVIILPGVYAMILFKMLNGDLAARGYPLVASYVFSPAVVLNLVLNFLLIPRYAGIGAAVASCVSYLFASLAYFIVYRHKTAQLIT